MNMTGLIDENNAVARLTEKEASRGRFIKGVGAVVLGLSAASAAGTARAANDPTATLPAHTGAFPATTATPDATQIDNYLQINPDNTATLFTGWVELGQGTPTATRMIAAEELAMTFDQIKLAPVDTNVSLSASTVGSGATKGAFAATSLRGAAAAARTLMLGMAATQLGVPVANLTVSDGVISGGSQPLKYSDLMAGKLFNSTIAAVNPTLTPASDFKIIGTNVPRQDIPAIVMATTTYTQNVRVPGMIHGRVVRPRGQAALGKGAPVLSIDPTSIAHIPGAQVVRVNDFVGVVAPHEYDAIQAAAELKVVWDETPSLPGAGNLASALRANAGQAVTYTNGVLTATTTPDAYGVLLGNPAPALASAAKTLSATYFSAYNGHVPIGPNCSIADVNTTTKQATIICFTQLPVLDENARSAGDQPDARVTRRQQSGGAQQRRDKPERLAGKPGANPVLRRVGHLRTQRARRRDGGGHGHVHHRRQARSRPADAVGRDGLGSARARAGDRHHCGSRREQQHHCLPVSVVPARVDVGRDELRAGWSRAPAQRANGDCRHDELGFVLRQDPEPKRSQQEGWQLSRLPEGDVPEGAGGPAVLVRQRADDRCARTCGQHGPDRVSAPADDHRPNRRRGRACRAAGGRT